MTEQALERITVVPKHNKIRLVYRVNKCGDVCSFIHVERQQAEAILQVFKYVKEKGGTVTIMKLSKDTKISKRRLQRIADKLAGVKWIDIKEVGGGYRRLVGLVVDVQRGLYHKKRNLPRVPKYLKAPYFFVSASP